jgi:hypothetical protein
MLIFKIPNVLTPPMQARNKERKTKEKEEDPGEIEKYCLI